MGLSIAVIDALVAAGATVEQLAAAVKADLAEAASRDEERREKARAGNADRQQRYRDKRKTGSNERNALRSVTECDAPPNDIYSNPPEKPGEANASPPPFADRVVLAWNEGPAANGARKAIKLDAARKAQLRARVKDYGEDGVLAAIANLAASKFHCGGNERGWRVHFGWVLEAKNCLKALEMADAAPVKAEPAPREAFEALCDREIERYRSQGNEREALVWEAKKRGEERRNGSTGPPRSVGALTAVIAQQVELH